MQQNRKQTGQALIIVVLILVVAMTVGLSVATRTITQLRTTNEEASSAKALSAAESGIEQIIKTGKEVTDKPLNLASGVRINTVTSQDINETGKANMFLLNAGRPIPQDTAIDLWLSDYPTYKNQWPRATNKSLYPFGSPQRGQLTIYWGHTKADKTDPQTSDSSCQKTNLPGALEIVALGGKRYTDDTIPNPLAYKGAYDPCGNNDGKLRRDANKFAAPTYMPKEFKNVVASNDKFVLYYYTTIDIYNFDEGSCPGTNKHCGMNNLFGPGLFVRLIPRYHDEVIGISGCVFEGDKCNSIASDALLPRQGNVLISVGAAGATQRKIIVYQGYPQIPIETFPYSIYTGY